MQYLNLNYSRSDPLQAPTMIDMQNEQIFTLSQYIEELQGRLNIC